MSYGPPPGVHSAPPGDPGQRRPLLPYLVLAVALVFAGSAGWYAWEHKIRKDPGIEFCKSARDGKTFSGAKADTTVDNKMTEDQYRTLRAAFGDSHHDDIRTAGVKMMDVLWQVQGAGDGMGALAYLQPMMAAVSDLQTACANHDIIIKLDTGTKASGSPVTSTPVPR